MTELATHPPPQMSTTDRHPGRRDYRTFVACDGTPSPVPSDENRTDVRDSTSPTARSWPCSSRGRIGGEGSECGWSWPPRPSSSSAAPPGRSSRRPTGARRARVLRDAGYTFDGRRYKKALTPATRRPHDHDPRTTRRPAAAQRRGRCVHGPSVREVLDGVTVEDASAHPLAGAHSIRSWSCTWPPDSPRAATPRRRRQAVVAGGDWPR